MSDFDVNGFLDTIIEDVDSVDEILHNVDKIQDLRPDLVVPFNKYRNKMKVLDEENLTKWVDKGFSIVKEGKIAEEFLKYAPGIFEKDKSLLPSWENSAKNISGLDEELKTKFFKNYVDLVDSFKKSNLEDKIPKIHEFAPLLKTDVDVVERITKYLIIGEHFLTGMIGEHLSGRERFIETIDELLKKISDPTLIKNMSFSTLKKIPSLQYNFQNAGLGDEFFEVFEEAIEEDICDSWLEYLALDFKKIKKVDENKNLEYLLDLSVIYGTTFEEAAPEFMPEKNVIVGINVPVVPGGHPATEGNLIILPNSVSEFKENKQGLDPRLNRNVVLYASYALHECTHIRYGSFVDIDFSEFIKSFEQEWLIHDIWNILEDYRCEYQFLEEFKDNLMLTSPIIGRHKYMTQTCEYMIEPDMENKLAVEKILKKRSEQEYQKLPKRRQKRILDNAKKEVLKDLKENLDVRIGITDDFATFRAMIVTKVIFGGMKGDYDSIDRTFETKFLGRKLQYQKSLDFGLENLDDLLNHFETRSRIIQRQTVVESMKEASELYDLIYNEFKDEIQEKQENQMEYSNRLEQGDGKKSDVKVKNKKDLDDKKEELKEKTDGHYKNFKVKRKWDELSDDEIGSYEDVDTNKENIKSHSGAPKKNLEEMTDEIDGEFKIPEYNTNVDGMIYVDVFVTGDIKQDDAYTLNPNLVARGKNALKKLMPNQFNIERKTRRKGRINRSAAIKEGVRIVSGRKSKGRIHDRVKFDERDYALLILADHSGSTGGKVQDDTKVIDVITDSVYLLSEACNYIGDDFAVYFYNSWEHTNISRVKSFNEPWGNTQKRKLSGLNPTSANRDGSAIRFASRIMETMPNKNKIILYIGDGKPNARDYSGSYGIKDTANAIRESRIQGIDFVYLNVDKNYGPDYFGELTKNANYARVFSDVEDLCKKIVEIYKRVGCKK